jgi:hypothetical protein
MRPITTPIAAIGLLLLATSTAYGQEPKQRLEPPAASTPEAKEALEAAIRACVAEQRGQEYFSFVAGHACMARKGYGRVGYTLVVPEGQKPRFGASTRF